MLGVVELGSAFLKPLELDLNTGCASTAFKAHVIGEIAGERRRLPSRSGNRGNNTGLEDRFGNDAANAALSEIGGAPNRAQNGFGLDPPFALKGMRDEFAEIVFECTTSNC